MVDTRGRKTEGGDTKNVLTSDDGYEHFLSALCGAKDINDPLRLALQETQMDDMDCILLQMIYEHLQEDEDGLAFDIMDIDRTSLNNWRIRNYSQSRPLDPAQIVLEAQLEIAKAAASSSLIGPDGQPLPHVKSGQVTQPQQPPNARLSPSEQFRRGIKRDPSQYPVLKEQKQWDNWIRAMRALARLHQVENVLNPNYRPLTNEDADLFEQHQTFMYSVFEVKLQTDYGKHVVREHAHNYDAQRIFDKLLQHARTSTAADLETSKLLTEITGTRLNLSSWKGSSESFIINWMNKVRKYESMTATTAHFSDMMKMNMLRVALSDIPELNKVRDQMEYSRAIGGRNITYDGYIHLVLSAAHTLDASRAPKAKNFSRHINVADTDSMQDDSYSFADQDESDGNFSFDIDTDFDQLQIHQAAFDRRTKPPFKKHSSFVPRMNREKWNALSPSGKETWDKLSNFDKSLILGYRDASQLKNPPTEPTRSPSSLKPSIRANLHDSKATSDQQPDDSTPSSPDESASKSVSFDLDISDDTGKQLLAHAASTHMANNSATIPQDVRKFLGTHHKQTGSGTTRSTNTSKQTPHGSLTMNFTYCKYTVSEQRTSNTCYGALIDRGANGGLAGSDVRIIAHTDRRVDISGIDSHEVKGLPIVTAGGVVPTQKGDVIAIFHQYAYIGQGKSIHSSIQLEHFHIEVNDRSLRVPGGQQCLITPDGYVHPLNIIHGLAYIPIRPYTDKEWDELPHVVWTSDVDWEPSNLDNNITDNAHWYESISDISHGTSQSPFDDFGNLRCSSAISISLDKDHSHFDSHPTPHIIPIAFQDVRLLAHSMRIHQDCHAATLTNSPVDLEYLRKFLLHAPIPIVQRTLDATTQYARSDGMPNGVIRNTYKSPYPALNVQRRNEPVATDTIYSDVPAIDSGGVYHAQLFVGRLSLVADVYPMKSDKEFVSTLQDNIRRRGAMDVLISDRASVEISNQVKQVLRALVIKSWQSEPEYQHQNYAERRYRDIKTNLQRLLNFTGAPAHTWLLGLKYVCFVMNHTAVASLQWQTPLQMLTGTTPDISALLRFSFWEPIYYKNYGHGFPSESNELAGRFVGISEHVGNSMTYLILSDTTQKILHRSRIRSALPINTRNQRLHPSDIDSHMLGDGGVDNGGVDQDNDSDNGGVDQDNDSDKDSDKDNEIQTSDNDSNDSDKENTNDTNHNVDDTQNEDHSLKVLPTIDPNDLIGRSFLMDPEEDGQRFCVKIVSRLHDLHQDLAKSPDMIKYRCSINDSDHEEIIAYNQIIDYLENQDNTDGIWRYKAIKHHIGPISQSSPEYRGSSFNVLIEWETGEESLEPLDIIAADDPVTCAIYAQANGLLDTPTQTN